MPSTHSYQGTGLPFVWAEHYPLRKGLLAVTMEVGFCPLELFVGEPWVFSGL